jgi:hypothetical protein
MLKTDTFNSVRLGMSTILSVMRRWVNFRRRYTLLPFRFATSAIFAAPRLVNKFAERRVERGAAPRFSKASPISPMTTRSTPAAEPWKCSIPK